MFVAGHSSSVLGAAAASKNLLKCISQLGLTLLIYPNRPKCCLMFQNQPRWLLFQTLLPLHGGQIAKNGQKSAAALEFLRFHVTPFE
jgi:hypothetical protein